MHTSIVVAIYIHIKLSLEIVKSQVLCTIIMGLRKMKKSFVDVGEVEVVQYVAGPIDEST